MLFLLMFMDLLQIIPDDNIMNYLVWYVILDQKVLISLCKSTDYISPKYYYKY